MLWECMGEDVCGEACNLAVGVKGVLEGFPEVWDRAGGLAAKYELSRVLSSVLS